VGKGIIISTKPRTVLGDQPLGRVFCEVVVTGVLKRDAIWKLWLMQRRCQLHGHIKK
jgi:hypothetical protein